MKCPYCKNEFDKEKLILRRLSMRVELQCPHCTSALVVMKGPPEMIHDVKRDIKCEKKDSIT